MDSFNVKRSKMKIQHPSLHDFVFLENNSFTNYKERSQCSMFVPSSECVP